MPQRQQPGDRRSSSGSGSIGKNVPENRNSGVIPNRQIALNARRVALARHVRRDRPRERERGERPDRDRPDDARAIAAAPNAMITTQKIVATIVARVAIQAICPNAIAYGDSGVAYIAW